MAVSSWRISGANSWRRCRKIPGQPGIVDLPTGHFPSSLFSGNFGVTAKRVGDAWLVVQGGYDLAQRVQVLNALRISKLDLHHLVSSTRRSLLGESRGELAASQDALT